MNENSILRRIPKVDELLNRLGETAGPQAVATGAVREVLDELRESILDGRRNEVPSTESILKMVKSQIRKDSKMSLGPVINATGIILHTNLGRAKMSERVANAILDASMNYSTLEYDVENGSRGSRHAHVEKLLTRLTGAEDALVVNNNAAALMLILSTLTNQKEVVISRGELIEIGGSFRIPEIMKLSGSILVEVGTTNKTHLSDFETAIHEGTAALLAVHTSNFKIMGFTETPSLKELAALGRKYGIPVINDVGSGTLINLEKYGITGEPTVPQSIADGADIVCFSGDKLLGGPQAGIIAGRKDFIQAMKKNQLARALRIDKLTLAALEATLRIYLDGTARQEIPTLRMIAADLNTLREKALALCGSIRKSAQNCCAEVVEELSQIGGGSVPNQMLPTAAVSICPHDIPVMELERRIRQSDRPIIARISRDRLLMDVRTLEESDFPTIAACIAECSKNDTK